jgi:hypothetical protein
VTMDSILCDHSQNKSFLSWGIFSAICHSDRKSA